MDDKILEYFKKVGRWQLELAKLRQIILDCGLKEEYKWMHPCYTVNGKNVVLIHEFKDYCAILFHKGVLLKDEANILIQQTENVQVARQIRFDKTSHIEELEAIIKKYIYEAIDIELSGVKIEKKETRAFTLPQELELKFDENPTFGTAFHKLSQGRQRGYLIYFSEAKQSKTREARIEKSTERILNGFGLKDCICGRSRRLPNCDGSHRTLQKT